MNLGPSHIYIYKIYIFVSLFIYLYVYVYKCILTYIYIHMYVYLQVGFSKWFGDLGYGFYMLEAELQALKHGRWSNNQVS